MRLDVPSLVGSKDVSNINNFIGGFDDHNTYFCHWGYPRKDEGT
jgi:hypothetical protein